MLASCLSPVAIMIAVFCVICSLLIAVEYSDDYIVKEYSNLCQPKED